MELVALVVTKVPREACRCGPRESIFVVTDSLVLLIGVSSESNRMDARVPVICTCAVNMQLSHYLPGSWG